MLAYQVSGPWFNPQSYENKDWRTDSTAAISSEDASLFWGSNAFSVWGCINVETLKTDTWDACGCYAWWRPWCRQCLHTLPIISCSSIINSLPPTSHLTPVHQTEDDLTTAWRTGQAVLGEAQVLGSAVRQSSARPPFESFLFSLSLASSSSAEVMFLGFHIWI